MAKIVNCKTCQKEVSSDAKVCPHCGQKLKMGLMKKLLLGVAGLIGLFIVVGIFSGESKPKEEPIFTLKVEGLGAVQGIKKSDVGIAIIGLDKTKTIGHAYISEQAQGEFIIVALAIHNFQKDVITVDSNSFKIIDEQKREFSHSVQGETALLMSNDSKKPFFLQGVNPGITASGYLVFDVPPGLKNLKLQVKGGMNGQKGEIPLAVIKAK